MRSPVLYILYLLYVDFDISSVREICGVLDSADLIGRKQLRKWVFGYPIATSKDVIGQQEDMPEHFLCACSTTDRSVSGIGPELSPD